MIKKLLLLLLVVVMFTACQFTETLVIQEDGTGRVSMNIDMKEMMAMGQSMDMDSTMIKIDSTVAFKTFLEEKKDSIAKLPKEEQEKLMKLKDYKLRTFMDPETSEFFIDVFVDFSSIEEANNLMSSINQASSLIPSTPGGGEVSSDPSSDVIGIRYEYSNNTFTRDSYIKDEAMYQKQKDSLQSAEMFMSSMNYKLKYTFPKKIKSSSIEDASYSLDGKTIIVEKSFLDYFKNPDVLDLQVELEN
ncbi:hypothetical protein INR76_06830 [Marixanthomonas sp. SCSIO 43207]|uniref:hypothetical protein n=1 Tax=Marixanthomonas sp. SCSIO 43207 TaxID=2779360 RepID=UPI001CAA11CA|nr:hypothetical protein [Marixanthomonas sp. SCSIO 43207]UAB82465.1 hypothetical protein INR76_06830 [Marixanthomonas sp. SCSIO 43207]